MSTYTDKLERLYLDQAINELRDYIDDLTTTDQTVIDRLNDKISRIEDEIDSILDNAYDMAETLELIDDAISK